ncbi:MAG: hypothetical protein HZA31_08765 [Opitutae bacterium]|nr:hypothetical protein [Opitutae bacterium]
MNLKLLLVGGLVVALGLVACQKQASETSGVVPPGKTPAAVVAPEKPVTVTLVPEAERSRNFLAVQRHLELGGTLYGFIDVDGDVLKLAGGVRHIADRIAETQPALGNYLKQDYAQLFEDLGLDDIKAVGLSSVPSAEGFRNRAFFYTPAGRHGLLAGLGGVPAPFAYTKLAPVDADLYGEGEVDIPAMYAAIKTVVRRVGGEATANQLEEKLKTAGVEAGLSVLNVVQSFKGRSATILRLDPERTMKFPGKPAFVVPAFSLLIRIDGVGAAVQGALAKLPMLAATQEGALQLFALKEKSPIEGLQPVLAVEGSTLYVATTREFLLECRNRTAGLDQNPELQRALAALGREGNALGYVSPRLFARLRQIPTLNPEMKAEVKNVVDLVVAQMPAMERPVVTVRINQPDGILIRSTSFRSLKQEVALVAFYNPVTIGAMAAMAIPAFQKVRTTSQDKAILNNLRMLSAATDQYCLEHGVDSATYEQLVGPDKYIKAIQPVAGENYRSLKFKSGQLLRVRRSDGRWIEYKP